MKKEELRQMIREELQSFLNEQAHQWWMKPAEAETPDAQLNPSQVHEEVCEGEGCLDEKSVPPPYDRKSARKMAKSQIALRKKIGDAMMRDEKKVSYFRKKHGDDWKSYLWAAASSAAFRQSGSTKSDDKKKK
jgi:hypothetical protein